MNPNDYTSAFAGLPDPSASFMQGVQNGAGLQQLQAQQQQQQVAQAQQQQMHADLADLAQNPTTHGIAAMSIKYPQLSENFKRSFDMLAPEQQQSRLSHATQVYAALQNGAPDVADKLLTEQAAAARNSGNKQDAKAAETMAALIKAHPEFAKTTAGLMISSAMGPDKFTSTFAGMGAEQRAQDEEPTKQREAGAKAGAAEADAYAKNLSVVGQTLGSLQGKNVKPEQAQAALKSLAARGIITKDELPDYLEAVPSDPKQLNDWLGSMKLAGIKPDEQMKFTTPDSNTVANNTTQLAVQDRIDARDRANRDAKSSDADPAQVENVSDMIASGRMAPLGAMAMRTPFGQAVMSRVAEKNPAYRAQDFGTTSKAEKDFATGKQGNSVRSFNVGLSHLDTLGQLADAMTNKDTQVVNRIGNYFATQTGGDAPVKFEAAKKVVTDEIVKAIVGAGGTGHDREEAAKTVSSANSPAQLRGVINTYKELMVGQLGGLEQQYRTSTGRDDFHKYLSPQAIALYGKHGGTPAPAGPAVGTVDGGFRFKGGDPSKQSSWEKL